MGQARFRYPDAFVFEVSGFFLSFRLEEIGWMIQLKIMFYIYTAIISSLNVPVNAHLMFI